MKREYYSTYKFYDKRGRRLSIFARPRANALEIAVITCAKGDKFSKKAGRALYEGWMTGEGAADCTPWVTTIPIKDDSPKKTFLSWCRENYFYMEEGFCGITLPVLIRGDETAIPKELLDRIVKKLKSI